jgi:hypothetical protein
MDSIAENMNQINKELKYLVLIFKGDHSNSDKTKPLDEPCGLKSSETKEIRPV